MVDNPIYMSQNPTSVCCNGKNIDGRDRFLVYLPRGLVRESGIVKGSKVYLAIRVIEHPISRDIIIPIVEPVVSAEAETSKEVPSEPIVAERENVIVPNEETVNHETELPVIEKEQKFNREMCLSDAERHFLNKLRDCGENESLRGYLVKLGSEQFGAKVISELMKLV